MTNIFRKKKDLTPQQLDALELNTFFDVIAPSAIKFYTKYFVCGNTYRSVWAVSGYSYTTEEYAVLNSIAAMPQVTLHVYTNHLPQTATDKIINTAESKNTYKLQHGTAAEAAAAKNNMQDIAALLLQMSRNKEPLLEVTVLIELRAKSEELLQTLQADIRRHLKVNKIDVDELFLLQEEGFRMLAPGALVPQKRNKYSRVLPASSAANLYPLNYSGKNDATGFYVGRDKYGSNIIVDLDARSADKTNPHCLVLGNSGEGKSYLVKLLVTNLRELGKSIVIIDPDGEFQDLVNNLGGTYLDFGSDTSIVINPLQVRAWEREDDISSSAVSQHIAYLRDFFASFRSYSAEQLDALEVFCAELYELCGITDANYASVQMYPQLENLYELIKKKYNEFDETANSLYTAELLRSILLSIKTICVGSNSKYFNGQTSVNADARVVAFGFKELLDTNENLLNAMLFNTFSFMHQMLISRGNTVGVIDELHLFLKYGVALNYIRADMKRVRKYDSALVLSSQNIADFLLPDLKEYTKPLFSIPTHTFLFYPGIVDKSEFIDALGIKKEEYRLISSPAQGSCLYRCGAERFLLQVHAPAFKAELFGTKGGR